MPETLERPQVDQPLSNFEIEDWNETFVGLSPAERIEAAYERLGERLIAASSFGPTSPVMLQAVSETAPGTPVVYVRTHHETLKTFKLVDVYKQEFDLDLRIYDAPVRRLPRYGSPAFEEFQREVKVEPFQKAIKDLGALAFMSGRMHWQSESRSDLEFVERKGDIVVINPVVDVSEDQVEEFFNETGLPRDENYFDPTKGERQNLECQLNTTIYERGA